MLEDEPGFHIKRGQNRHGSNRSCGTHNLFNCPRAYPRLPGIKPGASKQGIHKQHNQRHGFKHTRTYQEPDFHTLRHANKQPNINSNGHSNATSNSHKQPFSLINQSSHHHRHTNTIQHVNCNGRGIYRYGNTNTKLHSDSHATANCHEQPCTNRNTNIAGLNPCTRNSQQHANHHLPDYDTHPAACTYTNSEPDSKLHASKHSNRHSHIYSSTNSHTHPAANSKQHASKHSHKHTNNTAHSKPCARHGNQHAQRHTNSNTHNNSHIYGNPNSSTHTNSNKHAHPTTNQHANNTANSNTRSDTNA